MDRPVTAPIRRMRLLELSVLPKDTLGITLTLRVRHVLDMESANQSARLNHMISKENDLTMRHVQCLLLSE